MKKNISIVTACYNEKGNIDELHQRIQAAMEKFPQYDYEIICIDNNSTDGTRDEIRKICSEDKRFKAILNVRNFGHIRSPWHALLQARGDAVIALCSDLEDPPELIPQMLEKWEAGYKVAMPYRITTDEHGILPHLRKAFYCLLNKVTEVEQIAGFTGFGLFDKEVVDTFRALDDPYPYTRGLICELGWKRAEIPFHKPYRKRGSSKGNFFVYLDLALQGLVNHSKLPLRLATLLGITVSCLSFIAAFYYFIRKLLSWDSFQAGIAPAMIGIFFMFGLLFLFLGLLGEYIGHIVTHVVRRPLVIEEERLNFDIQNSALGVSIPQVVTSDKCDNELSSKT